MENPVDKVDNYVLSALRRSAERGVLPLTSRCDRRCVFCSHRGNPPGIRAAGLPPLSPEEVRLLLPFLAEAPGITIGESATRFVEGEPLTHPSWREILVLLREAFPEKPITITTSGSRLRREELALLRGLGGVEIRLSLQSLDHRRELLGCGRSGREILELVAGSGIPFEGSVVGTAAAGIEDPAETLLAMDRAGARLLRLYRQGYTRFTPPERRPPAGWEEELRRLAEELGRQISAPFLFEPEAPRDLRAEIAGVLRDSPAERAGLRPGDEILAIEGEAVFSRLEAHREIRRRENPLLAVGGKSGPRSVMLGKRSGEGSGLVFREDLSRRTVDRVAGRLAREPGAAVLTSVSAAEMWRAALRRESLPVESVLPVPNRFFGGNIASAGLLTVADFAAALDGRHFSRLLLPGVAFDERGLDLLGQSFLELSGFGTEVSLVEA